MSDAFEEHVKTHVATAQILKHVKDQNNPQLYSRLESALRGTWVAARQDALANAQPSREEPRPSVPNAKC